MRLAFVLAFVALLAPFVSLGATQAVAPDPCEYGVNAQQKSCSPKMDTRQSFYKTDLQCAQKLIGVTEYTEELSYFNDFTCASGTCGQVPGIAHRTWPLHSMVEVCDLQSNVCAIAEVIDRGPNVCLVRRTIDANLSLKEKLHMVSGTDRATYQLLSVPGVEQTAEPGSGPTQVSLAAIQAANAQRNIYGSGLPQYQYSYTMTPYGPGYIGTPLGGSPFASVAPVPISASPSIGYPNSIGSSPFSSPTLQTQTPALPSEQDARASADIAPSSIVIAQPSHAAPGALVSISWTSVGMSANAPCRVSVEGDEFASGNSGTQALQVPSSPGSHVGILLHCTSNKGDSTDTTTSVTVE